MGTFFGRSTPMRPDDKKPEVIKNDNFERFSLSTFNALADCYSMYQTHCSPKYLNFQYRKVRLSETIKGFNTDFICLQEIDHYSDFFEEFLGSIGYQSLFVKRNSE